MNSKKALKDIGRKLRDDARDIVDAKLPERLAELLGRLERLEQQAASRRPVCRTN